VVKGAFKIEDKEPNNGSNGMHPVCTGSCSNNRFNDVACNSHRDGNGWKRATSIRKVVLRLTSDKTTDLRSSCLCISSFVVSVGCQTKDWRPWPKPFPPLCLPPSLLFPHDTVTLAGDEKMQLSNTFEFLYRLGNFYTKRTNNFRLIN